MEKSIIQKIPEIIEASSKNEYGVAVFAILCIAAIAYILLKKSIKTKDKFVYTTLCVSAVVIVALVFVKIPATPKPDPILPAKPASPTNYTSGPQSPNQNNQDGDNNYSTTSQK
jgi:hypothetical protein